MTARQSLQRKQLNPTENDRILDLGSEDESGAEVGADVDLRGGVREQRGAAP